jgi:hypothetical protein
MKSLSERAEEFSQEEKTKRFEHVENQSVELSPGLEPLTQLKADIGHFVDDPTFLYQDFARRGEDSDIPTFRVQVSSSLHHLSLFWYLFLFLNRNGVVYAKCICTKIKALFDTGMGPAIQEAWDMSQPGFSRFLILDHVW